MTSGEKIGAALAKAVKSAAAEWKKASKRQLCTAQTCAMYRRLMASSAMTAGSICRCISDRQEIHRCQSCGWVDRA